ncbi:MAG: hypothetical protein QOD75_2623 [Blastocatellia bacterium]|jgi:hypothetical protein|nr:hypothetical protein [Blastocatellia bacterium]
MLDDNGDRVSFVEYLQSGRVVYPRRLNGSQLGRGQATLPDCKLRELMKSLPQNTNCAASQPKSKSSAICFVPINRRNDLLEAYLATQHVHAEAAVCIPKHCRRSAIPGQHAICFHKSHILANAVPVGFYFGGFTSTAGYVPATRLRIAPERLGSPLAFISKGCYPFLSGRSRKPRSFL